jgi:hypothetical protein
MASQRAPRDAYAHPQCAVLVPALAHHLCGEGRGRREEKVSPRSHIPWRPGWPARASHETLRQARALRKTPIYLGEHHGLPPIYLGEHSTVSGFHRSVQPVASTKGQSLGVEITQRLSCASKQTSPSKAREASKSTSSLRAHAEEVSELELQSSSVFIYPDCSQQQA